MSSTLSGCFTEQPKESRYSRKIFLPFRQPFDKAGNYTITVKQEIFTTNSVTKVKNFSRLK
jgi:hypothetical protein